MFCPRLYLFLRTHPDDWFCTFIDWYRLHFYPSTFVYSRISPKIQFLDSLLNSVAPWGGFMLDIEGNVLENLVCRSLEKVFFLNLPWNFRVSWAVFKKSWLERYIQISFMRVWMYLNQRVKKNRWIEWKIFQKLKKKTLEETEFHNSIQDWVFLAVYRW